jgi:pimeloyl-ACP methyl ester carboxylesterase
MLGIPLACAIAACGGGGGGTVTSAEGGTGNGNESTVPADPLNKYKTQTLNWVDCGNSAWQAVAKLQCVRFKVPKDYAAPEKGDITIEAMRVPAMSTQRKGAVFFNPGGPGNDGLQLGLTLLQRILKQNSSNPQLNALQAQLVNGYDLVGFNPRGTSFDAPLTCASDADQLVTYEINSARNLPGNFEAMSSNQQSIAQACQANPLTPYISTDATARDMDLLRHLMGDSKISYLGYSYGTWLGAWYGRLFPERVDRMVLDSTTDVSADYLDATEHQPIARDALINEFVAPLLASHPDVYGLGYTADSIRATLAALDPIVKKAYTYSLGDAIYRNGTDQMMNGLLAAVHVNQLIQSMPGATDEQIANAIATHGFVPYNSPVSNFTIGNAAQKIWNRYQSVRTLSAYMGHAYGKTTLGPDDSGGNLAVLYSVTCNDFATPSRDIAYWKAMGDDLAQKAPFFGGGNPLTQTCMYWNTPNIQRPPMSALQGLDILMLQSQYDSATPTPNAMKGFATLPKAHMIYVVDEYTHALFPYGNDCVNLPVLQYLLGQSPNWRQRNCEASGASAPMRNLSSISAAAKSSQSTETPSRDDLINEFKKQIGQNAMH